MNHCGGVGAGTPQAAACCHRTVGPVVPSHTVLTPEPLGPEPTSPHKTFSIQIKDGGEPDTWKQGKPPQSPPDFSPGCAHRLCKDSAGSRLWGTHCHMLHGSLTTWGESLACNPERSVTPHSKRVRKQDCLCCAGKSGKQHLPSTYKWLCVFTRSKYLRRSSRSVSKPPCGWRTR